MEHQFILHWDDLSDELQTKKIDQYIEHEYDKNGEVEMTLKEWQEDFQTRMEAKEEIKAHFPLSF